MAATLLLISNRPDDLQFAEEVAAESQLTLVQAQTGKEGAQKIAKDDQIRVIFADASSEDQYTQLEEAIQNEVGLFSDKVNANGIHFISSSNIEGIPYLIRSPLFGHFIHRNFKEPEISAAQYGRLVKATLTERAFGLSQMLKAGAKVQTINLSSTAQKQQAVEAVKNYAIAAQFQTRMALSIANAVDEILMNAMFDAPVDNLGKPTLSQVARTTVLELKERSAVEMQIAFDGDCLGITAVDLFGSLDKTKLLTHISKIYRDEEYKLKNTVAGAGLGLASVFRAGGSFFFVSEAGVRTEVTVFFKRCDSFREFKNQFRFISTQFYI